MNSKQYIKNNDTLTYICCLWGILNKCYEDSKIINSIENFDLRVELNSFKKYCELNDIKLTKELIDIFVYYIYVTANILSFSSLLYYYNNSDSKVIFNRFNNYLGMIRNVTKDNIDMQLNTFGELMRSVALDTSFSFIHNFDNLYMADVDNFRYKYRYWIRVDNSIIYVSDNGIRICDINNVLDLYNKKCIKIGTIGNTHVTDFDRIFRELGVNTEENKILILS